MNANPLPERSRIVEKHLAAAGITAQIHKLPASARTAAEAAKALGCEVGAIASSLLFVADDEPVLVMTSGRHRVDPVQLGAALGVDDVRLASAERVRSVTGQAIGGVAPTGHPEPIRTVIDVTLQQYSTIWSAAGTPHTVMALTFTDLITLTNGARVVVASD